MADVEIDDDLGELGKLPLSELDRIVQDKNDPRNAQAQKVVEKMLAPLDQLKKTMSAIHGVEALTRLKNPGGKTALDIMNNSVNEHAIAKMDRFVTEMAKVQSGPLEEVANWGVLGKTAHAAWLENFESLTTPKLPPWPEVTPELLEPYEPDLPEDLAADEIPQRTADEVKGLFVGANTAATTYLGEIRDGFNVFLADTAKESKRKRWDRGIAVVGLLAALIAAVTGIIAVVPR